VFPLNYWFFLIAEVFCKRAYRGGYKDIKDVVGFLSIKEKLLHAKSLYESKIKYLYGTKSKLELLFQIL
jgi:hypothetical protein